MYMKYIVVDPSHPLFFYEMFLLPHIMLICQKGQENLAFRFDVKLNLHFWKRCMKINCFLCFYCDNS